MEIFFSLKTKEHEIFSLFSRIYIFIYNLVNVWCIHIQVYILFFECTRGIYLAKDLYIKESLHDMDIWKIEYKSLWYFIKINKISASLNNIYCIRILNND